MPLIPLLPLFHRFNSKYFENIGYLICEIKVKEELRALWIKINIILTKKAIKNDLFS